MVLRLLPAETIVTVRIPTLIQHITCYQIECQDNSKPEIFRFQMLNRYRNGEGNAEKLIAIIVGIAEYNVCQHGAHANFNFRFDNHITINR